MAEQRRHVIYSGHVQGVGFRYTASRIAGAYQVSGWVRNQSDGNVELVVEGDTREVEMMLQELREAMGRNIHNEQVSTSKARSDLGGFSIRY